MMSVFICVPLVLKKQRSRVFLETAKLDFMEVKMGELVFFNIGWLDDDSIQGGGEYVNELGYGAEMYNFREYEGKVYGYVAVGRGNDKQKPPANNRWDVPMKNMGIEKLGASKYAPSIGNIMVIWVATHPVEGEARIVGWYRTATVYRSLQDPKDLPYRRRKGRDGLCPYNVVAKSTDAILVPVEERNLVVPRGKNGIGQCNVWYAKKADKEFIENVKFYIKNYK
jgi:hypothetical protein